MDNLKELCRKIKNILHMSPENTLLLILTLQYSYKKFDKIVNNIDNILQIIEDRNVKQNLLILLNNETLNENWKKINLLIINADWINDYDIEDLYYYLCEIYMLNRKDMVITPSYIRDLCFRILDVSANDILYDPCMGIGNILMPSTAGKVIGIEQDPTLYSIAYMYSMLTCKNADLFCNDCRDIDFLIKPNKCILNPPYTLGTLDDQNNYELSFIRYTLDKMAGGGMACCIVPQSALHINKKVKTSIRNAILDHHSPECIISLPNNIYHNAIISTCIAVFRVGVPYTDESTTLLINWENDGCTDFGNYHRPSDTTYSMIDEIVNLIHQKSSNDVINSNRVHLTYDKDWIYYSYINNDIPKYEEFYGTLSNYMIFTYKSLLKNRDYLFAQKHVLNISSGYKIEKNINNVCLKKWKLNELFEIKSAKRSKISNDGPYPYLSSTAQNNGHRSYTDFYTEEGGCITVESAINGYATYQEYSFSAMGHIEMLIPKFKMSRCCALFIVTVLNHNNQKKYNYGYKASRSRLEQEYILLPTNDKQELDLEYMEQYISQIYTKMEHIIENHMLHITV